MVNWEPSTAGNLAFPSSWTILFAVVPTSTLISLVPTFIPVPSPTAKDLLAAILPPLLAVRPGPAVRTTLVWSICLSASTPDKSSWSIWLALIDIVSGPTVIPFPAPIEIVLLAEISPPPNRPLPAVIDTVVWSICSLATKPLRLSCTICASLVLTWPALTEIPTPAPTFIVLEVVRSPPPVNPVPAIISTLEWSICSLASKPGRLSWFKVIDPPKAVSLLLIVIEELANWLLLIPPALTATSPLDTVKSAAAKEAIPLVEVDASDIFVFVTAVIWPVALTVSTGIERAVP